MPDKIVQVPGVGNVAFPDSMSDDQIGAVLQKQHPELVKPQGDQRGFSESFANSFGVDIKKHPMDQIKEWAGGLGYTVKHPLDALELIGGAMNEGQKAEFKKAYDATDKGENPSALAHFLYGMTPVVGPQLGEAASQMEQGNMRGGLGTTAGVATQMLAGSPEARANATAAARLPVEAAQRFASAEGDANTLYHRYLDPVAPKPARMPSAPKPVVDAVLNDMVKSGEIDAARADQIRSTGNATLGEMDQMRQVSNRLSASIERSPGNYPTGLAKGAQRFGGSLRDTIYPQIEDAHGLPSGSLSQVKRLQGQLMELERNPSLARRFVRGAVVGPTATAVAYHLGASPEVAATAGSVAGVAADPAIVAAQRGIVGLKTRALAMGMPEPSAPTAGGTFIAGQLPPGPVELGPSSVTSPISAPPPVAATTRAQRLGLLLPEKTGGPIELPYTPEMSNGERVAASDAALRRNYPAALPEKASSIQLRASQLFADGKANFLKERVAAGKTLSRTDELWLKSYEAEHKSTGR